MHSVHAFTDKTRMQISIQQMLKQKKNAIQRQKIFIEGKGESAPHYVATCANRMRVNRQNDSESLERHATMEPAQSARIHTVCLSREMINVRQRHRFNGQMI